MHIYIYIYIYIQARSPGSPAASLHRCISRDQQPPFSSPFSLPSLCTPTQFAIPRAPARRARARECGLALIYSCQAGDAINSTVRCGAVQGESSHGRSMVMRYYWDGVGWGVVRIYRLAGWL